MTAASTKTLVLIDGHSNVHKAFHAIRESLTNSKGEPTSAVYGFLNQFMRIQREIASPHIVVVFDPHGPTFRSDLFPEYKANRPPAPEELKIQEARIRQLLDILKVPVLEMAGLEADDVLASLAICAVENGGEALICSVDKDLLQVVRPGIKIWRDHLQKLEVLDEAGVVQKMGVRPDQVATYLGLVGDTADNIPGVKGIGAKGAAALLQEYGTLEAILEAAQQNKGKKKVWDNLVELADTALLSRQLATLKLDCVTEFDWEKFHWEYKASDALREFYREMEFQSLLREMGGDKVEERTTDYQTIRTRKDLESVATSIQAAGLASIDTETTDLDTLNAELVGISLSWKKNQAVYLPVGHQSREQQLSLLDIQEVLGPLLANESITWIAHHWAYDYKILKKFGLQPARIGGDTLIASYLVNPDRQGSARLKDLALQLLGIQMTEISELIGDGDDMVTMAGVTIEDSARYAAQDADATLQLHHHFAPKLKDGELLRLYNEVEIPLISVLCEMEMEGVRIDKDYFRTLGKNAEKQLEQIADEVFKVAGRRFNINSPKQVGELLFDELKLPSQKKGKSGAYSTDVTVLESLEELHPLPAKLLEYRQVEKLKNTYIDPLPSLVHPKTGKLHTSYNQTVAATGRLSSSNPNLQNIPIRTEAGRAIRQGFVPRQDGWMLVAADYSQIELRILAHLSGDAALNEAFRDGGDIHTLTASRMFKIPAAEVTSEKRSQAKAINFGIIYGMGDFRLSRDLGISRDQARRFIEEYFSVYSGVKNFITETEEKARRDGYVTTLLGRRRFVPEINNRNFNVRSNAERIAVNTPIQGTSADMIKVAMLHVAARIKREGLEARMILQVHDELIFDCPTTEVNALSSLVREEMTGALPLSVPLKVDVEVGVNWAEC